MAKDRESKRCAKPGCRAWAIRDDIYCRAHSHKRRFYSKFFTQEEVDKIESMAASAELGLDEEAALLRVLIARVLGKEMKKEENQRDPRKTLESVAKGVNQLVSVLRARRALSGEAADGLTAAFAKALDELSTELGVEL
jgi:DNA-binding ferritin-like protein